MINKAAVQSWFLFLLLFFRWATLLYLAQNFKIIYPIRVIIRIYAAILLLLCVCSYF